MVGYDTRFASEDFAAEVAQVTTGSGITTLLCDRATPTPVVSYNIVHHHAGAGAIITASHNPPQWNGFKYKADYGGSASPEVIEAIETEIDQAMQETIPSISLSEARGKGLLKDIAASRPYLEHITQLTDITAIKNSGLRIAVDSMYGAGAGYFSHLLEGGSARLTELRGQRNPIFPGMQQPEPVAHNLSDLSAWVLSQHCDVGIALDGDADRLGLVDEHGRFISTLQTFALLALYLLEVRKERGPLVKSITMTSMIYRLGELFNVPVHETPVGFKYLGPVMIREQALAAGEESGGYAFKGHIPERDGILSGLFLLDMMVKTGKRPSELLDYLFSKVGDHYFNRLDVTFDPEQRIAIEKRVSAQKPETLGGKRVLSHDQTDGTRFMLEDGSWTLIRFSGTEPLLRIYAEAENEVQVDHLLQIARTLAGV